MYGAIAPLAITQFIDYHRYHAGMDHFIFYDSGESQGLQQVYHMQQHCLCNPSTTTATGQGWTTSFFTTAVSLRNPHLKAVVNATSH